MKPDAGGQMQFSIRASSAGRMWNGFEASIYDVSLGVSARPPSTAHTILLHLSEPVEGTCRCDGPLVRRVIKTGDIDFVPFGYAATWYDGAPGRIANLRLSPTLMYETAEAMGESDATNASFPAQLSLDDPVLRHLMLAIVAELENENGGSLFAESVAIAIATHLVRRYALRIQEPPSRGLSRRQVSRIVDYIEAHLSSDLSLSRIASVAGISASHLKPLFKKAMGLPVHQFVLRRRVDYAVRLLSSGRMHLSDVAQQAGFFDQSHMTRCIRRATGMTSTDLTRMLHS